MKQLYVYRIRKLKNGVIAKGVGKRLALHFHPELGATGNVLTSVKPKNKIPDKTVVMNYGRSVVPEWEEDLLNREGVILNNPRAVALAVDKRRTLSKLAEDGIPCLIHTVEPDEALAWSDNGEKVIARHTTTGKKGVGVELVEPGNLVPIAPLYTKFYDKTHEFRVHVMNGKVIDYVQKKMMGEEKRKKWGLDVVDNVLRNHARGWVFARKNIVESDFIKDISIQATKSLGLDFAGVDVLARVGDDGTLLDAVVCEVNSAPGMSDTNTFRAYTNAIKEMYLQ